MAKEDRPLTSTTMVEGMRDPANREAWNRFAARYRALIIGWCKKRGLQEADAEDVSQNVVLKLFGSFTYDPVKGHLSDWLVTCTRTACYDVLRKHASRKCQTLLSDPECQTELEHSLRRQAQHEALEAGLAAVKERVNPRDWDIFEKTILQRCPAAELAAKHSMKIAAVHKASSRVHKAVKEQVREFGGDLEADA